MNMLKQEAPRIYVRHKAVNEFMQADVYAARTELTGLLTAEYLLAVAEEVFRLFTTM